MKQQIPPAAIVAAIVVVIAIAGFLGFRALGPDRSRDSNAPTGMTAEQKAQYESMHINHGGNTGRSSSDNPNYPNGGQSSGSPNH